MFTTILHVVQVLSALALIGIILIQQGKGASMGAAFGAGASATVFGARGAGSVLTRMTTILALIFFSVSFYMSYLSAHRAEARSIVEQALQAGAGVVPQRDAAGGTGELPMVPGPAPGDDLPALPAEPLPFSADPAEPTAAAPAAAAAVGPEAGTGSPPVPPAAPDASPVPAGVEAAALPPAVPGSDSADAGTRGAPPAP